MRGEPPVKLTLSQDSSLPRSTSETNLKKVGGKKIAFATFPSCNSLCSIRVQGHASSPNKQLKEHSQVHHLLSDLGKDPINSQLTTTCPPSCARYVMVAEVKLK